MKCDSLDGEDIVRKHFETFRWTNGKPVVKVKSVKGTQDIKLKDHEVHKRHSSWVPNYEAAENSILSFESKTYGNWHTNPRFAYKRAWHEYVEQRDVLGHAMKTTRGRSGLLPRLSQIVVESPQAAEAAAKAGSLNSSSRNSKI